MNILQVNYLDSVGGAARIAWNLHRGYCSREENSNMAVGIKTSHDPSVHVIPPSTPSIFPDKLLYQIGLWMEQQVNNHGLLIGGKNVGRFLKKTSAYRHLWTKLQGREDFNFPGSRDLLKISATTPDVVHLHNLHSYYFDLRYLQSLSNLYPTIITLHDMWLLTGHCAHSLDVRAGKPDAAHVHIWIRRPQCGGMPQLITGEVKGRFMKSLSCIWLSLQSGSWIRQKSPSLLRL